MAGDAIITIIGNLTAGPEMHFTPSGVAVASPAVASVPRTFDRQIGEQRDGETLFIRCSIWHNAAGNVAKSLTKGVRTIVQGRLVQRSYTTHESENRMVVEMQADEIGPSLRYAKAQVTHRPRDGDQGSFGGGQGGPQGDGFGGGQGGQGGYSQGGPQQGGYNDGGGFGGQDRSGYNAPASDAADDPWAAGGFTPFGDEPPF